MIPSRTAELAAATVTRDVQGSHRVSAPSSSTAAAHLRAPLKEPRAVERGVLRHQTHNVFSYSRLRGRSCYSPPRSFLILVGNMLQAHAVIFHLRERRPSLARTRDLYWNAAYYTPAGRRLLRIATWVLYPTALALVIIL